MLQTGVTDTGTARKGGETDVTPCRGDCGACRDCITRLPTTLVELMATSKDAVPAVFDTAVKCAGMWLRANPQSKGRRLNRAG